MNHKIFRSLFFAFLLLVTTSLSARAASFDISVSFLGGLTGSQQSVFSAAESFWEGVISGYLNDAPLSGISISAEGVAIDGSGGVLGSAGPTYGNFFGDFLYATQGAMSFDSADLAGLESAGTLGDVILHEMAHVIGFGTLWGYKEGDTTYNDVYIAESGQYVGAAALAMYQAEFNQPGATYIPVELGGGSGTANGHWNEVDGGSGPTSIVNGEGVDMQYELMTGWLNSSSLFVSDTTRMSFQDIGYQVNLEPVPEPATMFLMGMGVLGALGMKRRRKQNSC